jgi:hypothetical protein
LARLSNSQVRHTCFLRNSTGEKAVTLELRFQGRSTGFINVVGSLGGVLRYINTSTAIND